MPVRSFRKLKSRMFRQTVTCTQASTVLLHSAYNLLNCKQVSLWILFLLILLLLSVNYVHSYNKRASISFDIDYHCVVAKWVKVI